MSYIRRLLPVLLAGLMLAGAQSAGAASATTNKAEPEAAEMFMDVVVARPVGTVVTVLGTATFLVALPFSLLGGSVDDSAEQLVMTPARETFARCLGCTRVENDD